MCGSLRQEASPFLISDDNFITATKIERVKHKLIDIYQERFDFQLDVRIELNPEKESRHAKLAQETLEREIAQIVKNYEAAKKESAGGGSDGNDSGEKQDNSKSAGQKVPEKKPFVRREPYQPRRPVDDKDIFYGRGFDGEITPISDINDEIGDVVLSLIHI